MSDCRPPTISIPLQSGACSPKVLSALRKRAQFIGVDAYVAAGGMVQRDLFQRDNGGWLQNVALVEWMVSEKLQAESQRISAEGWKWIARTRCPLPIHQRWLPNGPSQ